ncbi:exocyst complex subunit 3 [Tieghemostelium lacteum]|uniref:Exocyst complex subunit 3 n=1 Tax=Tieghemostelium lacteum TaxID=361077 RepID=A0A152A2A6_TIELA|nr:exocyst complex subunit 3 [Tieghemostelium lacteum]|eukprot:KYR00334.1 exocyst complex subunit 3 [Tieghemostelium lacteum]
MENVSLVPLAGLDDNISQTVAIKKIEAHFSTFESLSTVTNHKQSLIQQKKTIEAQIKNEVHGELEKSKKGLETLHGSYGRIGSMSKSFGVTVDLCNDTSNLIGSYPLIKKVNTVRVNLINILKEVDRLLTIPEKAAEIEQLLDDDIHILIVHKKIRELERLHQKALKQFESNYEELTAIKEMFGSVPKLSEKFDNKIWDIVAHSISVAQKAPAVLVKVAQIIEREKLQEIKNREKKKKNLISSEGIEGEEDSDLNKTDYGDKFIAVLLHSISSRFEPMYLTGQSDLVQTLKEVNKMVDELTVVMDQVSECYPPSYDLFNFFVNQYHSKFYALFGSFSNIVESGYNSEYLAKQIPSAHILMLIEWVIKDYSTQLSRLGIMDMSPPLLDSLDPLISIYKLHIKVLMKDWCNNIINNDNLNQPESVDGQYSTYAPVYLFESVMTQIDIAAATKSQKLVTGVMEEVINALLYFQEQAIALLRDRNQHIKFENLIAYVNNNSKSYDFTQTIVDKVSNILTVESMASLNFDPVLEGFISVSNVATNAIAAVIFRDCAPTLKKFFTVEWENEPLIYPIINTIEEYFRDDIQPHILENYMKRLSLLCLDTLIEHILTNLITGKNKLKDTTAKMMGTDSDLILEFFKKYLRLSVATAHVHVLEDFQQLIICEPEMIPIYFRSIYNTHKDINEKIIENVLLQRSDINRNQIREQVDAIAEIIAKNTDPNNPKSVLDGIFSRIQIGPKGWF